MAFGRGRRRRGRRGFRRGRRVGPKRIGFRF